MGLACLEGRAVTFSVLIQPATDQVVRFCFNQVGRGLGTYLQAIFDARRAA